MALIYIDTNIFLDFYQSATDRLAVFEEILARSGDVLLTQQTIGEFHRNRVARLVHLAENIRKTSQPSVYTTAVVRDLPGFKKWTDAQNAWKDAAKEIERELRSWITNESSDPVLAAFEKLSASAKIVATSPELIERARTRKILGNPPTSPDKHTIGDELIWEALLHGASDDIVIVSRDNTFTDNQSLLKDEFSKATKRKLLLVTKTLTEALEKIGKASEKIKTAEKLLPTAHSLDLECSCGSRDLEEMGYEGDDGDSTWWFFCRSCGAEHFPPKR